MTEQNIVYGPKLEEPFEATLGQLTKSLLQLHGDKILQVDSQTREEYSATHILQKSSRLARWLQSKGFGPGDTISIISENRIEFCLVPVAAFLAGITIAPLNPEYTPDELQHTLNLSKPKLIFCSPNCLNRLVTSLGRNKFIENVVVFGRDPPLQHSMVTSFDHIMAERFLDALEDEDFESPDLNSKEIIATILCSSGTTGMPKGVMTTQHNMVTYIALLKQITKKEIDTETNEVTLGLVPFFHSMGFMIMTLSLLSGRKTIVIRKFRVRHFLQTLQDYKVTLLAVPPPVIVLLCQSPLIEQYDLSSIEEIRCGAAPISVDYIKMATKKFNLKVGVLQAYGMTETTLGVTFMPEDSCRDGSVGKIVPTMSGKVVGENGKALGANCEGELCFKGPLIMKGYINDPVSTANTIDKDGWLHTGDIGYFDNDAFFYVVDRMKELIKYKAYQVPPAELEAILMSHSNVLDAAVIGLPDDRAGELPLGYVVLKPFSDVKETELQEYVKGKVSPQKQLRGGIRFVESIPRNPTGKILRRVLKKMAIEAKSKL